MIGYEDDDDLDVDALLAKAENLVAKTGINAGGEGKFSSELVQIRRVQALLLEARLCLEMVQAKSDDEDVLPNNSKEAGDALLSDKQDGAGKRSQEPLSGVYIHCPY